MDIKDFILIGGGLLIAAVIAHGFWIAWRARRDPLRMDIVPDLVPKNADDLDRLRAELPNGGARVIRRAGLKPEQANLGLEPDPSLLLEPIHADAGPAVASRNPSRADSDGSTSAAAKAESGRAATRAGPAGTEKRREPRIEPTSHGLHKDLLEESEEPTRGVVTDVIMPERPIVADEPKEPRRWPGRRLQAARQNAVDPGAEPSTEGSSEQPAELSGVTQAAVAPQDVPAREAGARAQGLRRESRSGRRQEEQARETARSGVKDRGRGGNRSRNADRSPATEPVVEELIVIHVVAARGQRFEGPALVEALRARGLRYGEMNIFHRLDPMTRAIQYSVANVLEPGTFDMAEIDDFRSPGVSFFMQLPGPEHPRDSFEDMLEAARSVALQLGGELKDEQRSVMTGQTVEHYRQRIADFCRRLMSMRA